MKKLAYILALLLAASTSFAAERKIVAIDEDNLKIVVPLDGDTYTAPVTLEAATGNEAALTLDYTVNKATSGDDTGLVINQTDTASPGTSLLADFQVGGTSKLQIRTSGSVAANSGGFSTHQTPGVGAGFSFGEGLSGISSAAGITWRSGTDVANGVGLILTSDGADNLAQRRTTNAQTFNIYNTYTDASNYERTAISGTGIIPEAAGTGTQQDINLGAAGSSVILPLENDYATPTLAFGDGDSGFYEASDDVIRIAVGGNPRWAIGGSTIGSMAASGGQIGYTSPTGTVPAFYYSGDGDTGLGSAAADQLSLIAGGVEGIRISEDAGNLVTRIDGQIYGMMYVSGGSTAQTMAVADTPELLTAWAADGLSNGVTTAHANDYMTATVAGTYDATGGISFSGDPSSPFVLHLYKYDDSATSWAATGFSTDRKLGTGGDVGSAAFPGGYVYLDVDDRLAVYVESDATDYITVTNAQFKMMRISD